MGWVSLPPMELFTLNSGLHQRKVSRMQTQSLTVNGPFGRCAVSSSCVNVNVKGKHVPFSFSTFISSVLLLAWDNRCFRLDAAQRKPASQMLHLYGFSSAWIFRWYLRCAFWVNGLPQIWQTYGFIPVNWNNNLNELTVQLTNPHFHS